MRPKLNQSTSGTWQKVSTPESFEKTPLTDLEIVRFRELMRQHPRDIYYPAPANQIGELESDSLVRLDCVPARAKSHPAFG